MTSPSERLTGTLSERYRTEREIGAGGMAVVFLAHDLKHDRQVAIKILRPELSASLGAERFIREIRLIARLSHPHILPLLDSGAGTAGMYFVMPFIEGESLRKALDREGVFGLDRALAVTRQVAAALDYAHRQGIIHRDIKPENILLHEGEAMVADFGIAVAVSAAGGDRLTATGVSMGTPSYMSPEQILGERDLDARADIYALACVLFEMLTGQPPHAAPTMQGIAARRIVEPAPHVTATHSGIPDVVDAALARALDPDRDQRFDSAAAFAESLGHPLTPGGAPSDLGAVVRMLRRPAVIGSAVLVAVAVVALVMLPARARAAHEAARAMLPRIAQLAAAGRYVEAFALAERAERSIGSDATLGALFTLVSDRLTILSEPGGARVRLQAFAPDTNGQLAEPRAVGVTPIHDLRLARGDYRVILEQDGFAPVERLASTAYWRAQAPTQMPNADTVAAILPAAGATPERMVHVPGGRYVLSSPDMPTGLQAVLDDYWLDQYEVTNEAFKAFVLGGGYTAPEHWPSPFEWNGQRVSREQAMAGMVDRTALPAPRDWVGQDFAAGTAAHPVTGVSWYEASAYCHASGKQLPTVYQWEKAARNGTVSYVEGVMMPWGYMGPHETPARRANFGGKGTAPVDAYPFGISSYGAYGMAGNAKEWTRNPMGDGFVVTGGSWEDPTYLYSEFGVHAPGATSRALGFRCVRATTKASGSQGAERIVIERRTPTYTPVDQKTFESLLTHYRYDRHPLAPRIVETVDSVDWTRQKVRFVGVAGDSMLVYLYLPKQATAPYQTMVFLPSSGTLYGERVPKEAQWLLGPSVKAGRALLAVVLKGMTEREREHGYVIPEPNSVRYRDRMVLWGTELRLSLDYLETRVDIDAKKLAYVGLSLGAGSALPLAGVDSRFSSVILIGGGIDERMQPTLPEASSINFAPYIRPPKLLLNGRNDEENPYFTRALPLWNLLRPPKKLVLVQGAGHAPPLEARVPAINAWLDSTLGPVRR